jgi:hypothetical protein
MGRLFGIHELELRNGVSPDEFERFAREDLSRVRPREGQTIYVIKGDRGERQGKYALVFEYESVQARDRDVPSPNADSEELVAWLDQHYAEVGALFDRLSTFVQPDWDIGHHYTDYVVINR